MTAGANGMPGLSAMAAARKQTDQSNNICRRTEAPEPSPSGGSIQGGGTEKRIRLQRAEGSSHQAGCYGEGAGNSMPQLSMTSETTFMQCCFLKKQIMHRAFL